ncbi:SIMPL domain-containing protein [Neopusillimonas aromaticivorans]|uniref:SIMPL domain-containing protein n=1 Tax=Neopusillimonas aromaticivorans TaxID=2979868 RepID=UPI00259664ED|nr:SIMPL domain-containing protein [Neopusillimonas aromaticivorans]WJJ94148.1 SIMPL domain-containing protein [Neopusillimonas aromaticivorans]
MQIAFFKARRNLLAAAVIGVFGVFGVVPVSAQGQSPVAETAYPLLTQSPIATLSASATSQVEQDTVRVTLSTQVDDASREKVSANLDRVLESVLKQARAEGRVKASSGNYRVWPVHADDGKIKGWQGRADILIESSDFSVASVLAGQLSDRMGISNLYFFVSTAAREATEAALLDQAAKAFVQRAQSTAKAFGYHGFRIKELALDGGGADYAPMPRMMLAGAAEKTSPRLKGALKTLRFLCVGRCICCPKVNE